MKKNEYTSIEQFISQYTGEWNPSEGHWLGLDFIYHQNEYRFHTGSMYNTDSKLPDGREVMFGLYKKNTSNSSCNKQYELLGEYADMEEVLQSTVIEGILFRDVIMDDSTELVGQD